MYKRYQCEMFHVYLIVIYMAGSLILIAQTKNYQQDNFYYTAEFKGVHIGHCRTQHNCWARIFSTKIPKYDLTRKDGNVALARAAVARTSVHRSTPPINFYKISSFDIICYNIDQRFVHVLLSPSRSPYVIIPTTWPLYTCNIYIVYDSRF